MRRADLVVRPIPEIRLCMVYRPRPARLLTLNTRSWLLLAACDGGSVDEIEAAVLQAQHGRPQAFQADQVLAGLQQLLDLSLVELCRDRPALTHRGATT